MVRSYGRRRYKRYNKRVNRSYKRFKKTFRKWKRYGRKSKLINSANKRYVKLRYVLPCEPTIREKSEGIDKYNGTLRIAINSLRPGPLDYNNNDAASPATYVGAHLPLGVSDLQSQFKKYCVVGAKVTFKYNIKNASSNEDYAIGIRTTSEDPFSRQVNNLAEIVENAKMKYIWEIGTTTNVSKTRKITHTFSTKKFFGKKNPSIEDDLNANLNEPSQNPDAPLSRAWVDIIIMKPATNTSVFSPIQGLLIVDYVLLCTERKAYGLEEIRD